MSEGFLASNGEPAAISFNRIHKMKELALTREKSCSRPQPSATVARALLLPWQRTLWSLWQVFKAKQGEKNGFLRPHWSQKAQKVVSQVRACHSVKNCIPGVPYLPAASAESGKTCPRDGDAGSHGASTAITIAHHLAGAAYTRWALLKASSTRH